MIPDPQQNSKKLRHLKDDTAYFITIWALTSAGGGEAKITTESTRERSGKLTHWYGNVNITFEHVFILYSIAKVNSYNQNIVNNNNSSQYYNNNNLIHGLFNNNISMPNAIWTYQD